MEVICLEEHFVIKEVQEAWKALDPQWQDVAIKPSTGGKTASQLREIRKERLSVMDETGVDVQVLSLTSPGLQNLSPDKAVSLQGLCNDILFEAIEKFPDRFSGLATLATPSPEKAAMELERSVKKLNLKGAMLFGRTRNHNLDHTSFWPIFESAEALSAPLYLHPQSPTQQVRTVYYNGISDELDAAFATHGIGWHYETGMQLIRLILNGIFDRFPDLQIIVGHWGEVVLFYLERLKSLAKMAKIKKPILEYFRNNIFITPSGMYSQRYMKWAVDILGIDRILLSTDYPFVLTKKQDIHKFFEESVLNDIEQQKIANLNWKKLCSNIKH